jgi:hypothetical protein
MVMGLVEKIKERPFGRNNSKWISKIIGWESVDGINLAQRDEICIVVKTVMNLPIPSNKENKLTS